MTEQPVPIESEMLEIQYELTEQDLVDFNMWHMQRSPAIKKTWMRVVGILWLIAALAWLLFLVKGEGEQEPVRGFAFVASFVAVIFTILVQFPRYRSRAARAQFDAFAARAKELFEKFGQVSWQDGRR